MREVRSGVKFGNRAVGLQNSEMRL